jgi:succinate dehydrogenase / fumarate reductase cytochrome b subunit
MIISGIVVLSFMALHFYDFWVPEMKYKYVDVLPENPDRYFEELVHKFEDPLRVGIYCISFIFLALHLVHGFASSFKSIGTNNKYAGLIKKISYSYGILIPLGFCFIAVYHYYSTI